jgi:hypothetical protein
MARVADGTSALTRSPRGLEALPSCLSIRHSNSTTFDAFLSSLAPRLCIYVLSVSFYAEDSMLFAYRQPMLAPTSRGVPFGEFAVSTITHALLEKYFSALHVIMYWDQRTTYHLISLSAAEIGADQTSKGRVADISMLQLLTRER